MEPSGSHNSDPYHTSGPPSPSSFTSSSSATAPLFPRFGELPPELRQQIWAVAVPRPGINMFNVHCIPNDHAGANRSTSPSWLYLDVRRLSIDDDDDAVASYDPSAWRARAALAATSREARAATALRDADAATLTLTRPARGLTVRAGDGQLRARVPTNAIGAQQVAPEPLVRRRVRVHRDDVLCLSVENCSFSLPFEELPVGLGGGNVGGGGLSSGGGGVAHSGDSDSDYDDEEEDDELGWAYDPQLVPAIPSSIPPARRCLNMARGERVFLDAVAEVGAELLADEPYRLIMFDAHNAPMTDYIASRETYWDRFGDRYVRVTWALTRSIRPAEAELVKVSPEMTDIRERYLRSASLQSSKRPVQSSRPKTYEPKELM
ncbi:hypothetical protein GGR52DRAFT_590318 [Hypoxylon sp. FL1284]|nr:hypothetical protein GGR52DRAFT_590318 [Hypoxylon sp. FL1284]